MAIKKCGKVPTKTWLPFDVGFSERLDLFGVEVSTSDGKIVEFLAGGQFCDTFDSVAHLKAVFLTSGLSGHLLLAALLRLFYYGVRPRVIRVGQPFTVFCHGIWYAPDIKKIILLIGLSESDPGFAISESIINKAKEFVVNHQAAVREWETRVLRFERVERVHQKKCGRY